MHKSFRAPEQMNTCIPQETDDNFSKYTFKEKTGYFKETSPEPGEKL